MEDFEIEFYANIGLLTVRFAQMENNLCQIIGKMINSNDPTIAFTIIKDNTLDKNKKLLQDLNHIKGIEVVQINKLIEKIKGVQKQRNLCVHGIWGKPFITDTGIRALCESRKISYSEEKDKSGKVVSKHWKFNEFSENDLVSIKQQIGILDEIIGIEEVLLATFENENDN